MLSAKKIIIFTSFLLLILNNNALHSNELFVPNLNTEKSIKIELTPKQYSKFVKNMYRASIGGHDEKRNNIQKKYKKWFKAKIISNDKKFKARIRITGEWKDHINLPYSSLKVKLLEGSYKGVTRFKLFLPKTRAGSNEIFWTLSLKHLGLPVYHTQFVNVEIGEKFYQAIFQEESSKEFLERNSIRETVILRSNDQVVFTSGAETLKLRKNFYIDDALIVDNGKFIKNPVAAKIASRAINLSNTKNFYDNVQLNDFYIESSKIYAPHGISKINRKFIFLPIENSFIPLYYDGNVSFPFSHKIKCKIENYSSELKKINLDFKKYGKRDLKEKEKCIFSEIAELKKKYEKKVDIFNELDLTYNKKYNDIRNKIISYLSNNKAENSKIDKKGLLYSLMYKDKYFLCRLKIEDNKIDKCRNLSLQQYKKYLTKMTKPYQYKQYDGLSVYNLGALDIDIKRKNLNDNKKNIYNLKDDVLYIFKDKNINQTVTFNFENLKARLLLVGDFKDKTFNFFNNNKYSRIDNTIRYNENLITGCVSFYRSQFDKVNIVSKNLNFCEDSVNIMNSHGQIDNIYISNAFADAADFDVSNLKLKNLKIINAGNDCLDFSFGKYELNNLDVENCADKGISIGEKSEFKVKNFKINNTEIGIAVKDSSSATLVNGNIIKSKKYCLASYNKKEEFGPSKLYYKKLNCENGNSFERGSLINNNKIN